jgi:DNA-binding HxlR family transcriptional regulator
MKTRSYNQFCALSFALDAIGERWTLLVIRELLPGPRRFTDLLDGLPGISTNLLTERLKSLEGQGIIARRTLPPPAASTVYELTPFGRELETPIIELGRWGSRLLPSALDGLSMPTVGTASVAIKAFYNPAAAQGIYETYEWRFGVESLQVQVKGGQLCVQQGQYLVADVIFHADMTVFMGLFSRQLSPDAATAAGLVRIEGDPQALYRFLAISSVPQTAA